ncbi:MAG: polysaccharide deacetylase family protein [Phormidesmis sp. RL_2_1]|nr:polysaccharide deacetylase family protein [Phormidesmis sp. RL_2_1]
MRTLKLVKEIRTPIYRIQLFQRQPRFSLKMRQSPQRQTFEKQPTPLPPEVDIQILWEGGKPYETDSAEVVQTEHLPILMYHQIGEAGPDHLKQWRVAPDAFEAQLRYLRDVGYYSVSLEAWCQAIEAKKPLPGKAICMTFDDGYLSFFEQAWPLLKKYGFTATVFLVAHQVGQMNDWDARYGDLMPLMNWQHIQQLQNEGVRFGSHTVTHRSLTMLSAEEIVTEGARSRAILEEKLATPIRTIAYPYGDTDPAIAHLMGACGYLAGVSCNPGLSNIKNSALLLPRQEITGFDSLKEFITKLELGLGTGQKPM